VAITPGAGFIVPGWAALIGFLAGAVCFHAVCLKSRLGYDDSLDVVGVHGVGGTLGALLTGVFATVGAKSVLTGDAAQLGIQALGAAVSAVYAFGVTFALAKLIDATMGLRADPADELTGLDQTQHGEVGYSL
jgi:Amt family ammonium transporter